MGGRPPRTTACAAGRERVRRTRDRQFVGDAAKVPVAGGVAAPGAIFVTQQDQPGDRWLASFVVAVEDVDGDATRGVERLGSGGVKGRFGVAESGLPEPDPAGADEQVSLLRSERRHARQRVAPAVPSCPLGIPGDDAGRFGLEVVGPQHRDARSEIAQRDCEVDGPARSLGERPSGGQDEDLPVRELHLGWRIVGPGGREHWALGGEQGSLGDSRRYRRRAH